MKRIMYDYSFMMADRIGEHGIDHDLFMSLTDRLQQIHQRFQETKPSFTKLAYDQETVAAVKERAKKTSEQFASLIVLGIGGSDLGARATISALTSPYRNFDRNRTGMRVFFLGGNTDPQEIADVLAQVDLAKTAINIISKSGDTIEPMAAFVLLRDLLIKEVGRDQHARHIIATTDASKGTMREIVDQNAYESLVVPDDVGGRFSVLSTVGLFPAACAGVDVNQLIDGARTMDEAVTQGGTLNIAQVYAALHYLGYTKRQQNVHVVMPYAEHLRQFGFWYRQLWAESLGKKENLSGQTVNVGPTPVAALGSTDQHSQMQLYNEGPFDKLITFIRVEEFAKNFEIPQPIESNIGGLTYMVGHNFAEIINTEAQSAAIALAQNGRPSGTLVLPELNEEALGELFMLYEWATAYMGELLDINTYNQPGVQAGKDAMYALLGRSGFEEQKRKLEKLSSGKKYTI